MSISRNSLEIKKTHQHQVKVQLFPNWGLTVRTWLHFAWLFLWEKYSQLIFNK